jgi:8-oxo-dGTP diphosphatase
MEIVATRQYPSRPMVGVGAAVLRGDQVLIVQRGRQPAYGLWSVPGGLVELGESLHEAVRREIREEASLEIEIVDVVAVLDRVIPDHKGQVEYHYVLIDFLCHCEIGEPLPGSDALDCRFVSIGDLPRYPLTSGSLAVVHKALSFAQGSRIHVYDRRL